MNTIEIARKLAEYGQKEDAQKAYTIALQEEGRTPKEELEAASYLFFSKGNYKIAYTTFYSLYERGHFQADMLNLMTQAFYQPNEAQLRRRYEENCKVLAQYPYLFRQDFLPFEELPIRFYPFDETGYLPFSVKNQRFSPYVDFNAPVIDRNFFHDLEKPVLAEDVYSQYQLEYLNDNVRKSEWVGRENHIYLHYTDWTIFCAHLQCLSFTKLLREKKLVFLIGEEISQYPIDFKARFGIDYGQYPVRPIGVQEVTRLIWHTQLSAHNGGDFFNEIFYGHPNLLAYESLMFDSIQELLEMMRERVKTHKMETEIDRQLSRIKHPTDKDLLVAYFLSQQTMSQGLDPNARIAPALFFQPHFSNIVYQIKVAEKTDACILYSEQYEQVRKAPVFQQFKYIKTFTPIRRPTTSYAATLRFMTRSAFADEQDPGGVSDVVMERLLNRSYLLDPEDRLYKDSILVRFEDGKLNPKATFSALAAFLDLPYTQSMTYCSGWNGVDPEYMEGNVRGFDPATVYRTYDDYADDADRAFLEYFLRDAYEAYGYDFHYYHGEPVDEVWVKEKISGFHHLNGFIKEAILRVVRKGLMDQGVDKEEAERVGRETGENRIKDLNQNRVYVAGLLMRKLRFVNQNSQPLKMSRILKPDSALLEQPLYH